MTVAEILGTREQLE